MITYTIPLCTRVFPVTADLPLMHPKITPNRACRCVVGAIHHSLCALPTGNIQAHLVQVIVDKDDDLGPHVGCGYREVGVNRGRRGHLLHILPVHLDLEWRGV